MDTLLQLIWDIGKPQLTGSEIPSSAGLILLQAHNDIGPQWHYTDIGHVKLASALLQFIRMKLGWEVEESAAGPEVLSGKDMTIAYEMYFN